MYEINKQKQHDLHTAGVGISYKIQIIGPTPTPSPISVS